MLPQQLHVLCKTLYLLVDIETSDKVLPGFLKIYDASPIADPGTG